MKHLLTAADVARMMQKLGRDLTTAEPKLTALDSVIGDGDLGMTLTIGFREIEKLLSGQNFGSVTEVLSESAEAFAEVAASTFGTLLTVMMKYAGRSVKGQSEIGTPEAAAMLEAAVAGVQKRGKAALGDKTLLDALIPAAETVKAAAENGRPLPDAASAAVRAAKQGAESTVAMKARTGRSGYLGERTIGQMDPGAAAVVIILQSFEEYILNE